MLRLLIILLLSSPAMAQTVRGVVLADSTGDPLPGAIITLLRTGASVLSGPEGHFELAAVSGDILQCSHAGLESKRLPVTDPAAALVFRLSPLITAEAEVTVYHTGYQSSAVRQATGAVSVADQAILNRQVGPTALERLAGQVPGLAFDNHPSRAPLTIRGLSTLNGPQAPLVIVDHFPYEGNWRNLNPNDIESISVLKDAAAGAIWGARAGNGVIVITTKKARLRQAPTLEVNANATVTAKPDLSVLHPMATDDFIGFERGLFAQGFYDQYLYSPFRPELSPVVELLLRQAAGEAGSAAVDAQFAEWADRDVRDDFEKQVYQRGFHRQYAVALRGGSETATYALSSGYDAQQSVLAAPQRRLTVRWDHSYRPLKALTLTTSALYTASREQNGRPAYGTIALAGGNGLYPYAALDSSLPFYRKGYTDTAGGGKLLPWDYRPLEEWRLDRTTTTVRDLLASVAAQYRVSSLLSAELRYQYEHQQTDINRRSAAESFYARDLVNQFTPVLPKGGVWQQFATDLSVHNVRGQVNVHHTRGEHQVQAVAGAEYRQARTRRASLRRYGYDPELETFAPVDFVNPYPNYLTGYSQFLPNEAGLQRQDVRFVSVYANGAYTLKGRYIVSASARRDGSNLFGATTNKKWTPLWSAGLAWIPSGEPAWTAKWLPYLKLRTSYGFQGNVSPAFTAVTTMLYFGPAAYTGFPAGVLSRYANPELRWETVRTFNAGVDFGFAGDRVTGSVDVYRKMGRDLYGPAPIDYTAGVGSYTLIKNVASMRSTGVDLQVSSQNTRGAVRWGTTLVLGHNRSIVTDYYLASPVAQDFVGNGSTISGVPGKAVYGLFAYRWAGLDPVTGQARGWVEDKESLDHATIVRDSLSTLVYRGSQVPTWSGSLSNTLSFRGVQLTVNVAYKLGYFFRKSSIQYGALMQTRAGHADYAQRWQQPGDEAGTSVPSFVYGDSYFSDVFYANADVLVRRGDHLRLQFVHLSWTLPERWGQRIGVKRTEWYANASNLGLLWTANAEGIDPDYPDDARQLPLSKSFTLGLRLTF